MRLLLMGLATVVLAAPFSPANAQTAKRKKESHPHHETNATRLARIHRTIEDTYAHRYEVTGGGGYLRFRSGDATRRNNEVSWATALDYYLNPKLAVVGDARGSFGDAHAITNNIFGVNRPQINEYTFMGGVNYRFYAKEKVAFSVEGLGGTAWGIFSGGSKGIPGPDLGLWNDGFRPAFSASFHADYNVFPNLGLRFSPTWVGTNFVGANGSSIQNNLGFNVGILYRFGHR